MKHKILNTKEVKKIKTVLKDQFGFEEELPYVFLLSKKEKFYIVNRDIERLDLNKLKLSNVGIYFAKQELNGLRLSMEGTQLIGPYASKNVLELDKEQVKDYFKGHDIEIELKQEDAYLLLKQGKDFFGCARYKKGKLLNFLSKVHRGPSLII